MLLLDTCALVWLDSEPDRFSPKVRQTIRDHTGALFVSAISALEVAIKSRKGKLILPCPPERWFSTALAAHGLREIAVDSAIAVRSAHLPLIHSDPFDRIIVATAQSGGLSIVTPDPLIHAYPHTTFVW